MDDRSPTPKCRRGTKETSRARDRKVAGLFRWVGWRSSFRRRCLGVVRCESWRSIVLAPSGAWRVATGGGSESSSERNLELLGRQFVSSIRCHWTGAVGPVSCRSVVMTPTGAWRVATGGGSESSSERNPWIGRPCLFSFEPRRGAGLRLVNSLDFGGQRAMACRRLVRGRSDAPTGLAEKATTRGGLHGFASPARGRAERHPWQPADAPMGRREEPRRRRGRPRARSAASAGEAKRKRPRGLVPGPRGSIGLRRRRVPR